MPGGLDFSDLTFDKVYLTGAAAPRIFADKQIADKPANAEITLLCKLDFAERFRWVQPNHYNAGCPYPRKISKADITTHEEIRCNAARAG